MMTLTQNIENGLSLSDQRALWRFRNRTAVNEIARQFGLSRTFVYKVFRGEMSSGEKRVEQEFARRGCPGF